MAEIDIKPKLLELVGEKKYALFQFRQKIQAEVLSKIDQDNPDKDEFISKIKKNDPTYKLFWELADPDSNYLTRLDCVGSFDKRGGEKGDGEISKDDINNFDNKKDGKITIEDFGGTTPSTELKPKPLSAEIPKGYEIESIDGKPTGRLKKTNGEKGFAVQLSSGVMVHVQSQRQSGIIKKGELFLINEEKGEHSKITLPGYDLVFKANIGHLLSDHVYSDNTPDTDLYTVSSSGELISYRENEGGDVRIAWVYRDGRWKELFFGKRTCKDGDVKHVETDLEGKKYFFKDGGIISRNDKGKEEKHTVDDLLTDILWIKKEGKPEKQYVYVVPKEKWTSKQEEKSNEDYFEYDDEEKIPFDGRTETLKYFIRYLPSYDRNGKLTGGNSATKFPLNGLAQAKEIGVDLTKKTKDGKYLRPGWGNHEFTFLSPDRLESSGPSTGSWYFERGFLYRKVHGNWYQTKDLVEKDKIKDERKLNEIDFCRDGDCTPLTYGALKSMIEKHYGGKFKYEYTKDGKDIYCLSTDTDTNPDIDTAIYLIVDENDPYKAKVVKVYINDRPKGGIIYTAMCDFQEIDFHRGKTSIVFEKKDVEVQGNWKDASRIPLFRSRITGDEIAGRYELIYGHEK